MTKPKPKRLTLLEAKSSRTADLVDRLIDSRATTAAAIIRRLDRNQVDLALLHAVSSVDERWRARKPLPLPETDEDTERMRRQIAAILTERPEAIVAATLAIGDAINTHDPRRQGRDEVAA